MPRDQKETARHTNTYNNYLYSCKQQIIVFLEGEKKKLVWNGGYQNSDKKGHIYIYVVFWGYSRAGAPLAYSKK
jgi:hypothetical protein